MANAPASMSTTNVTDELRLLADDAPIGSVLLYTGGTHLWDVRDPSWAHLIMLTKTARGFELIDGNGRSRGVVNMGEPYHNLPEHPSCTACDQAYVWQNAVPNLPFQCGEEFMFVGNCTEGWSVGWCPLEDAPSELYVIPEDV